MTRILVIATSADTMTPGDAPLQSAVAGTPVLTTIDPAPYDALFLPGGPHRQRGARHEGVADFLPFALRDGQLVTGQNPASAAETARLLIEAVATSSS